MTAVKELTASEVLRAAAAWLNLAADCIDGKAPIFVGADDPNDKARMCIQLAAHGTDSTVVRAFMKQGSAL